LTGMARKHDHRKSGAGARGGSAKGGGAGRPTPGGRVAKRPAKPAPRAAAKTGAAKAAPPATPKVKYHGRMLENEPLSRYTPWRIGGPARYLLQPADQEDIVRALDMARVRGLPWLVLGLGSNVLVRDEGFPGLVIRMGKGLDRFEMKGAIAIVGAGMAPP